MGSYNLSAEDVVHEQTRNPGEDEVCQCGSLALKKRTFQVLRLLEIREDVRRSWHEYLYTLVRPAGEVNHAAHKRVVRDRLGRRRQPKMERDL